MKTSSLFPINSPFRTGKTEKLKSIHICYCDYMAKEKQENESTHIYVPYNSQEKKRRKIVC